MSYVFNNEVAFVGNAVDAFNRVRTSTPVTLFDSHHQYQQNDRWSTLTATGGTSSYNANESCVNMIVGPTAGSICHMETKRVFPYQPGKSLLTLATFAMGAPKENLRQRVGYFGENNGIFFEREGMTAYMTLRSKSSGTVSDARRIPQTSWNADTFDGNGNSGIVLGATAANIWWCDIEWLGVGDVRTGFVVDGRPVVAHTFQNANLNTTTYMSTANLPVRYEASVLPGGLAAGATAQMKHICASVQSEAGLENYGSEHSVTTGNTLVSLTNSAWNHIFSMRLNQNRQDKPVYLKRLDAKIIASGASTHIVQYKIVQNASFTTSGWDIHSRESNIETSLTGTSLSFNEADVLYSGYISSDGSVDIAQLADTGIGFGRNQRGITGATGSSDTLSLIVYPLQNSTTLCAAAAWKE